MDTVQFEKLVADAVSGLPEEFRPYIDDIDIVIEDEPTARQIRSARLRKNQMLLGLYEGIPRTNRSSNYGMVPPDKITIFQKNIEIHCRTESEIVQEVGRVVRHEIAHHFGLTDARLKQIESQEDR